MARCYQGNPVYRQFYGEGAARSAMHGGCGYRDVYYTGPCPRADPCDRTNMGGCCGNCANCPCCGQGRACPEVFAFYADCEQTQHSAGEAFALDDSVYSIGPISKSGDIVTIGQSGRYSAVFTVSGTAQHAFDTTLALFLEGEASPCAARRISAQQGETVQAVVQQEFWAERGDALRLLTSGAINIDGTPAVTLTIMRLA